MHYDKEMTYQILGVHPSYVHDNYLGLPLMMDRSKTMEFRYLVDRVKAKVKGWNVRFLSQASKEILIKVVA